MKWISYLVSAVAGLSAAGLLVALGCHSASLKGPVTGSSLGDNTRWMTDYKKARASRSTDPELSCHLFSALEKEEKFPARQLAGLRKMEVCENPQSAMIDRTGMPEWMRDIALDINLKLVTESDDKVAEMELATEKSKQNLPQFEKLKWIRVAMERAKEMEQTDKLEELQKRMYTVAPRLNPEPKVRDFLEVAGDFRLARQFTEARDYYERVLSSAHFTMNDKISALKGIRLSYKNARQKESHIGASLRLVQFLRDALKKNPKSQSSRVAYHDAELYYGRALWTAHRASECRKVFDRVEQKMKGRVSLAEVYWLKARLAEEQRSYDDVSKYLTLALAEPIRDGDLRDRIYWYSAWNERQRKNYQVAADLLADLEGHTQSEFTRMRALFWLGKSYSDLDQKENAKATFQKLVDLDPVGYYGLLAHRNLDMSISFKAASKPLQAVANLPLDLRMAEWLALLDERDALTAMLDQSARAYRKQEDQSDDGWVTLFQYYAKGGLYMKLYESLGSLPPERRKSVLESHPDLLFPQPWSNEVRTASLQFGVDQELIYAIMRQESAFDPQARSFADAFGLMQVLPEVAEALGSRNNIPYAGMDDLYDPKTNVMVGAAHLRELLSRHRGQFILAVAAYNANENAIRNWMRTRFKGDSLEFIEEIPYEETRTYVRLVMRNLIFYSLLNSKNASIEFPAWVLKLEDAT